MESNLNLVGWCLLVLCDIEKQKVYVEESYGVRPYIWQLLCDG